MKMSVISLACGIICTSIASANLIVPNGTVNTFTGTINSPETASVAGQLNVNSGTFSPTSLTINGNGTTIVSPPGRNGDVYFNGGTITPGTITNQGFSNLYVNSNASTTTLNNDATVIVNSNLGVNNAGSGTFTNTGTVYIHDKSAVNADVYVGSGGSSAVAGVGGLNADTITLAGAVLPGDLETGSDVGTISMSAGSPISFADATYIVDFKDNGGTFGADSIQVTGEISLGGNSTLIVPPVQDLNGSLTDGQIFNIMQVSAGLTPGDIFTNIDEANYTVDNGVDVIGNFTVGYNTDLGLVSLTYHATLPEPTSLGGLSLLGLGLLRRRKAAR